MSEMFPENYDGQGKSKVQETESGMTLIVILISLAILGCCPTAIWLAYLFLR